METKYDNLNKILDLIKYFSAPVFTTALFSYLLFFLLDSMRPGFVSYYLDLNLILWITFISGFFLIVLDDNETDNKILNSKLLSYLISICGGLIIYYQIKDLGWIAILISIAATIIILLTAKNLDTEE